MAKVISLALAAWLILAAVGCGGSGTSTSGGRVSGGGGGGGNAPAETTGSSGGGASNKTESAASTACPFASSVDRSACRDSYISCTGTAKAKVQAFTSGNGPTLTSVATNYAKRTYGSSGTSHAGFAGCLAAFVDEYNRLH